MRKKSDDVEVLFHKINCPESSKNWLLHGIVNNLCPFQQVPKKYESCDMLSEY